MSALGLVVVYLLGGLLSTIRFQRHPWSFARNFYCEHWILGILGWPISRMLVWSERDVWMPRKVRPTPVQDWLRTFQREDAP